MSPAAYGQSGGTSRGTAASRRQAHREMDSAKQINERASEIGERSSNFLHNLLQPEGAAANFSDARQRSGSNTTRSNPSRKRCWPPPTR